MSLCRSKEQNTKGSKSRTEKASKTNFKTAVATKTSKSKTTPVTKSTAPSAPKSKSPEPAHAAGAFKLGVGDIVGYGDYSQKDELWAVGVVTNPEPERTYTQGEYAKDIEAKGVWVELGILQVFHNALFEEDMVYEVVDMTEDDFHWGLKGVVKSERSLYFVLNSL
jgi:hypothetical protein